MAEYLSAETLTLDTQEELATYYAAEVEPLSALDDVAEAVRSGELTFSEALDFMEQDALESADIDTDLDTLNERLSEQLSDAIYRREARGDLADEGGTVAMLKRDMSPRMAEVLGLDSARPPRIFEVAHMLNGLNAKGETIAGKRRDRPMMSLAAIYGLDPSRKATTDEMRNVLGGKRADGGYAVYPDGNNRLIAVDRLERSRRRLLTAYGVRPGAEPNPVQMANLLAGRRATGAVMEIKEHRRIVEATKPPTNYLELVFRPDKSFAVAWALAETMAERAMLLKTMEDSVERTMRYVQSVVGVARIGPGGRTEVPGETGYVAYRHYTARPTAEIASVDAEGVPHTEALMVPLRHADPLPHMHVIVPNVVLTEDGHVGSLHTNRLDGAVKETGAVFHAYLADTLRDYGVDVGLDQKTGSARLHAIPEFVRTHYSKRTLDAERDARRYARESGLDWDTLSDRQRVGLLKRGALAMRQSKREGPSDFAEWRRQAERELGYHHRSVLRPDVGRVALSEEERITRAYEASLPLVEDALKRSAVISSAKVREFAARGLIESGIGDNPARDIKQVMNQYLRRGVKQDGETVQVTLMLQPSERGNERWVLTTEWQMGRERELRALVLGASHAAPTGITRDDVDVSLQAFLSRRPDIDPTTEHWKAQAEMARVLATDRYAVGIGVPGSGKSTVLEPLIDLWHARSQDVYGVAVPHRIANEVGRSASILHQMSIPAERRTALASFLRRVETGRYKLSASSVVVFDELGQVDNTDYLKLMRLREKIGFSMPQIGDPLQCRSVGEGDVIGLIADVLGERYIPKVLTTVRQQTEREREIVSLVREGQIGRALDMKRADGTAHLVVGGRRLTVERVANLWRSYTLAGDEVTVSAPTNADAREVSAACRVELRRMGRIAPTDHTVVRATDRTGETFDLPLTAGDRVRVFDRVYLKPRQVLASNGDVLDVVRIEKAGFVARNRDGLEGLVSWGKITAEPGGPVRLVHGHVLTIDSAQGSTADRHIEALVSGSAGVPLAKHLVASSRHRISSDIVLNESAERREVEARVPLGVAFHATRGELWANIEANLSRVPERVAALATLQAALRVQRGVEIGRYAARQQHEQEAVAPAAPRLRAALRMRLAPRFTALVERAGSVAHETAVASVRAVMRAGPTPEPTREQQAPRATYRG